jgi:DNA (cytosine-5)-methyltransferase 1
LNKLSLFSGIGGDDLASEWAGIETVCFVECDKYCQQVLKKHWPEIPIIEDVKDVTKEKVQAIITNSKTITGRWQAIDRRQESEQDNGNSLRYPVDSSGKPSTGNDRRIDIIAGGFPCQPHSVAGKRQGSGDERNLWPEFRRIIGEIKPRWVVAENVQGLFSSDVGRFFGEVLADLAVLGYTVGWCTYGAVDVGALHRRNRVFIVAYSPQRENHGRERGDMDGKAAGRKSINPAAITGSKNVADTDTERELQSQGVIADIGRRISNGSQDVSNTAVQGLERAEPEGKVQAGGLSTKCGAVSNAECPRWPAARAGTDINTGEQSKTGDRGRREQGKFERRLGRVASRLPSWVDGYWNREPDGIPRVTTGQKHRVDRLKGLGNAVVPQQIYPVYKAIMEIEQALNEVEGK